MDRITRKELKTDKFAQEVGQTLTFFEEHRQQVLRYGAIALAVVLVVGGLLMYRNSQKRARQRELSQALQVLQAPVGAAAQGGTVNFPTEEAKAKEASRLLVELAARRAGTDEGIVAEYYLASMAAEQGRLPEAEKRLLMVVAEGGERYASLARLSLADLYFATQRSTEGEKQLRSLIDHPTAFVSKEHAQLALARGLAASKPAEARKLLEPLRTSNRPTISQTAIQMYADIENR